jgi:hypothetical protein
MPWPTKRRLTVALVVGAVVGTLSLLVLRAGLDVAGQVSDLVGGGLTVVTFVLACVLPPCTDRQTATAAAPDPPAPPQSEPQNRVTVRSTGHVLAADGGDAFSGVSGAEPQGSLRVGSSGAALAVGEGSRARSGVEFRTLPHL